MRFAIRRNGARYGALRSGIHIARHSPAARHLRGARFLLGGALLAGLHFRDTALISRPEVTEQALADFLDILSRVPLEEAQSTLRQ